MPAPRQDLVRRLADLVGSPELSGVIGLAGVIIPVIAWVNERANTKALLMAETVIVLALTANHLWLRSRFITLRPATNLKGMDDAVTTWSVPSWRAS
ncbi:hypothetical protein ACIRPT_40375 [Streptomyces sp. NPDC101227]|uniref:hypothetical protein n=1 Tax=Streptomyces sp. NPDC101227 TaxID=3366136 RepID=UPI003826AE70